MEVNEYIQVFEAIIYAAIVTEFLKGFSRMITQKGSYKMSFLYALIVLNIFLFTVQRYYSGRRLYHYADIENSTINFLLYIIVPVTCIFIITYIFLPKSLEGLNTLEHSKKYRRPLAALFLIPVLCSLYRNYMNGSFTLDSFEIALPILFSILLVLLYFIRSFWYYVAFNCVAFIAILYFLFQH